VTPTPPTPSNPPAEGEPDARTHARADAEHSDTDRSDADRTGAEHSDPSSPTGAIRTLGPNPATAPIVLHPGDSITRRRRILYILVLGALTALGPFTIDLYLPAFPILEHDFNTTASAIQLTLTGTMIGFGLGQLVVGPWSDKVGRRIPLLTTTSVHIIASVAAAVAPTLELLAAARVLQGAGAAAGGVVAVAIVRDLFGGKPLVLMLSRLALVSGVAPVIAPLIGSGLLLITDWRGIFLVLAIYGAVMLSCAIFLVPETLPVARRQERGSTTVLQRYRNVLGDRVFLGLIVIGSMTFSGLFSYLSASSFLFQETYGFDAQLYGVLFAVNSLGVVLGVQIASRLAARFGPQWVMAFSTAGLFVFGSMIYVFAVLDLGLWGTLIPLFLFITSCGFTFPCVQVLALDRHGREAGTAASLIGAANFSIAGLVSPVVGLVSHGGITAATMSIVMVGCSAIGVLALWLVVRPRTIGQLAP
jgi:DHA1 family bicyclomycin/chloramphenicol resistance-like MFS transporter